MNLTRNNFVKYYGIPIVERMTNPSSPRRTPTTMTLPLLSANTVQINNKSPFSKAASGRGDGARKNFAICKNGVPDVTTVDHAMSAKDG